ncbi:hypothetical protein ACIA5G_50570 [Amycolatopsis sp. NPDC051758]|uniref:hypothetical protein n=1 Tax=Amycolatopsis sp. NPDC051758 TaxID=3363935 RepID=UPI0037BCAA09
MPTTTRVIAAALGGLTASVLLGAPAGTAAPMPDQPAAAPSALASDRGGPIARAETLARAQNWVDRSITYTQTGTWATDPDGAHTYRRDCSGLVSMAWHLGSSLVTNQFLDKARAGDGMHVIPFDDLRPGDAMVRDSDGSGSDGHMELFSHWVNSGNHSQGAYVYSFNSTGETVRNPYANNNFGNLGRNSDSEMRSYTPIRYNRIVEDGPPNLGVLDFLLSDDPASNVHTRAVINYGNSPMVPIVGDWDGNGTDTPSGYDPTSATFLVSNTPETGQAQYSFRYGNPGAQPLVGDWDGDGKDNVGVRMGNTFFLRTSSVASGTETTTSVAFGDVSDIPVIGDWDGDGKDNVGFYRPSGARFYLRTSANTDPVDATTVVLYGNTNVQPLIGDWNGDGKDNIGVRMGNTFFFRTSEVNDNAEVTASVAYGNGTTEIPIVGDWDGNGTDTQGIVA